MDTSGATIQLVSGREQTVQKIERGLRFVQGEWPLDQNVGFPYYNSVFTHAPTIAALRSLFARRIRNYRNVTGLADLRIITDELGAGNLVVEFEASTVEGGIQVKDTIPVQQLGVRI